jgi:hypothetical protein
MIKIPKRQKPRQVKFYCSEEHFNELQRIKIERNISLQSLMLEAVHFLIEKNGDETKRRLAVDDPYLRDLIEQDIELCRSERIIAVAVTRAEHPMVKLWVACIRQLPDATVHAFSQLMQDTWKYFAKTGLKPKKFSSDEFTHDA